MSWVYVLKSLKDGKLYIGSTRGDVEERVRIHNRGSVRSTKGRRPFRLLYTEYYKNYSDAKRRELFLKTGVGREEVESLITRAGARVDKGGRL